ncbi:MAG: class I SAM-dependent methyltransferase [Gammaproteobacteria bacterium]|nr:class I SAM-dependent methyltransferase [Gammaproteobacteria bacterium]MCB1923156.1 class I SAM-dependent methyltransferase [Gammaproteobacteria bacterium]
MNAESLASALDASLHPRLSWSARRLVRLLQPLRRGVLSLVFADAEVCLYGARPGPAATLHVERPGALLRRLMWRGDLGFAEAYIAGDWHSEELAEALHLFAVNLDAYADVERRHGIVRWLTRAQHRLRRNTLRGSRRNISAHYDLGNDFYARWLDPGMTYSAGLFTHGDVRSSELSEAQQHKYQRMLALSGARPGQTILEIGCGWGGFAEYAAQRGHRVIGLTLSREQLAYARQRIAAAGLQDLVDLRLCDYRNFHGEVDHIVSIEMFEAVGSEYWETFFATMARCLRPGGQAALQVITIDETLFDTYASNPGGFIQRYIFPGGMLPTVTHLNALAADAGMAVQQLDGFGRDYAETLVRWREAFDADVPWLDAHGYDARFRRTWRYYLAFCEAGFTSAQLDVVQIALRKE